VASISVSAVQDCATDEPVAASATTVSSSISTSADVSSAAVITKPPRINERVMVPPLPSSGDSARGAPTPPPRSTR
jgi:hypothetical protein